MDLNGKGARKNKKVVLAGTFALPATSLKTNQVAAFCNLWITDNERPVPIATDSNGFGAK